MEVKDYSVLIGIGITVVWVLKVIASKMLDQYFQKSELLEEKKEWFINDKINRLNTDISVLSNAIKHSSEEYVRLKITLQGLTHEIAAVRSELKTTASFHKESMQRLVDVLKGMQNQLKSHSQDLEYFGKIIIKMPESK